MDKANDITSALDFGSLTINEAEAIFNSAIAENIKLKAKLKEIDTEAERLYSWIYEVGKIGGISKNEAYGMREILLSNMIQAG